MEIKQLNKVLANLQSPDPKVLKLVKTENGHQGVPSDYEGNQGEYNEFFSVYEIIGNNEYFLKITFNAGSYGNGGFPVSAAFVKPTKKEVTVYE